MLLFVVSSNMLRECLFVKPFSPEEKPHPGVDTAFRRTIPKGLPYFISPHGVRKANSRVGPVLAVQSERGVGLSVRKYQESPNSLGKKSKNTN